MLVLTLGVLASSFGLAFADQSQTVTFDDIQNRDLNAPLEGQYPTGVIDWGDGAWFLSGPWQAKQLSDKMGRMSRLNSTGLGFGSAAGAIMHPQRTTKPVHFQGLAEDRRIICFPLMKFCGPPLRGR